MRTTNHKYGLPGLRWSKDHWDAYYGSKLLYRGPDFFEACCARRSYENMTTQWMRAATQNLKVEPIYTIDTF